MVPAHSLPYSVHDSKQFMQGWIKLSLVFADASQCLANGKNVLLKMRARLDKNGRTKKPKLLASTWTQSVFATTVLLKWAWGTLSAPDLQELAMACKLAGNEEPEVDELASVGGYGLTSHNCHKDLLR